jgi:hypothetical protein
MTNMGHRACLERLPRLNLPALTSLSCPPNPTDDRGRLARLDALHAVTEQRRAHQHDAGVHPHLDEVSPLSTESTVPTISTHADPRGSLAWASTGPGLLMGARRCWGPEHKLLRRARDALLPGAHPSSGARSRASVQACRDVHLRLCLRSFALGLGLRRQLERPIEHEQIIFLVDLERLQGILRHQFLVRGRVQRHLET